MSWAIFEEAAPALAREGRELLARHGLALVGTLRRDGFPRISPVEPLLLDGELYLGMMPRSRKALDLLRDPRCVVHSATVDTTGAQGDFKVYGRTREVTGADERERYCVGLEQAIGWRPSGDDFHLFALVIEQVGLFRVAGGAHQIEVWRPGA